MIIINKKIILDDDEEILDYDEIKKKMQFKDPMGGSTIEETNNSINANNNFNFSKAASNYLHSNSQPIEINPETPTNLPRLTRSSSNLADSIELLTHKRRRGFKRINSLISSQNFKSSESEDKLEIDGNTFGSKKIKYVNEESVYKNNAITKTFSNRLRIKSKLNLSAEKITENKAQINNKLPCSICLDPIIRRSSLDTCEHEFCRECIDQWALLSSHCPLCKEEFRKIISWEANQKIIKRVKKRKFKYDEEEAEPWYNNCAEACMVCNKSNDEHLLLVCDSCTYNICHTYCAGLDLIPDEDWNCRDCIEGRGRVRGGRESNLTPISNRLINLNFSNGLANTNISNSISNTNTIPNISNNANSNLMTTPVIIKKSSSRIINDEEPPTIQKPKSRLPSLGKKDREIAASAIFYSQKKNIRLLKVINGTSRLRRNPRSLSLGPAGRRQGYSLRREKNKNKR